jgi:3-hydroxyacyl-[acyl-carrier-protein] dehydratase
MRFLFYDSVTQIEKGVSITGVKSFSLTEEFLRGHYEKRAMVPGVLLIEAMAQLLGWLIIYSHDFKLSTFLALAEDAVVTPDLRPGFSADIHAELISTSKRDSLGKVRMCVGGREIARANRVIYGHVSGVRPEELRKLFGYYSGLNGAVR